MQLPVQWPFAEGVEVLQRAFGPTPAGVVYLEPLTGDRRAHRLRFVGAVPAVQPLRTLVILAHRYVRTVEYWPDYVTSPEESWIVALEVELQVPTVEDDRLELVLAVFEQSPETV